MNSRTATPPGTGSCCPTQRRVAEQLPTMLGGRGSNVAKRGTEHIVGIIGTLELEQARIIGPERRRDALLLPHVQQIDVATVQRIGRQGAGGFLCPRRMLLALIWRLWLPTRDDFDH